MEPNPYSVPTAWNFNPIANTSNVIAYDGDNEYDSSLQPYDGFSTPTSTANWKNPTLYQSSLVAGATQQYYGGPSEVPLYAAPTTWYANATPDNEAGQYDPESNAYVNLWPYDGLTAPPATMYSNANTEYSSSTVTYSGVAPDQTLLPYDSADRNYAGSNGKSFDNWKNPTSWTPIAPGAL